MWLQGGSANFLQPATNNVQKTSSKGVQDTLPGNVIQPAGGIPIYQPANTGTNQENVTVQGLYDGTGNVNGTGTGTGGSGSSSPSYDQSTVDQFDSGISALEAAMGRISGQHSIANQNVRDMFSQQENTLNSSRAGARNQYDTSSTSNMQALRTNKNNILDQQSQGLRGLLRTLGMYGAVGSDAQVGSGIIADQATQQRSGAGTVHSQNQRSLDTNWGNFENADKNERKKLTDWKGQQLQQAESQAQSTKQDLLSRLAELKGQRAATVGGSFKGAAQPYLDQANSLSKSIDGLARFKPTFDGKTPVYQAPALDSYRAGEGPTINAGGQPVGQTPALNSLLGLGRDDEEKRLQF